MTLAALRRYTANWVYRWLETIFEALYIYERNKATHFSMYHWLVEHCIELYNLHQKFMSANDPEEAAFLCPLLFSPNYFHGWRHRVRCPRKCDESTKIIRMKVDTLTAERTSLQYAIERRFVRSPEEHLLEEENSELELLADGPDGHEASIVSLLFSGIFAPFYSPH